MVAALLSGAVVAKFVTAIPMLADVVDVGCGHGALCAYVLLSEPLYVNVSPDAIGCGGDAIGLRELAIANGVCPTQPNGFVVGVGVGTGVGVAGGVVGGVPPPPPPPPPHATRPAEIKTAAPIAKRRVFKADSSERKASRL